MENASKALLIAGGILILIILVSLVLLVKGNISNYYASEEELKMTEDKTKFNEQFTRYNRNDVAGYELISLSNKIIDYNERLSSETSEGNDVKANPVKISIILWKGNNPSDDAKNKLSYDGNFYLLLKNNKPINKLIEENSYLNKNKNNKSTLEVFNESARELEKNSKYLKGLTKNIDKIILKEGNNSNQLSKAWSYDDTRKKWSKPSESTDKEGDTTKLLNAILKFESITQSSKYSNKLKEDKSYSSYSNVATQYDNMLNDNGINMYKYYEYSQFTKAKFKCTSLKYDDTTGKVNELTFEFTGEIE